MCQFLCAIFTRILFILLSSISVWRVIIVKKNSNYWCLLILFIPLVIETFVTLKRRKGWSRKWFSPAIVLFLISIIPSIWILELDHQYNPKDNKTCVKLFNTTQLSNESETVCAKDCILGLHQTLLILLILGKWLMPEDSLTREQLSQQLLVFVGTAADILEFTSETMSDVKNHNIGLVYIILGVWTWSMLQFFHNLSVLTKNEETEKKGCLSLSLHRADIWTMVETLLIQDGPFLVVRVLIMTRFNIIKQMLVFFTIKNILVVLLNVYRLFVICCLSKRPDQALSQGL